MISFLGSAFRNVSAAASALLAVAALAATSPNPPPASAGEARSQIEALRREIAHHDELYHRHAAPEISDYDYDRLKIRLHALEQAFPAAAAQVPPLAEVGDDRSGLFQTVRHRERMLSLDKTYSEADLRAFHARLAKQLGRADLDFVIEPKFDGFAVSATFEKGKLVRAVTRGNGLEGDDITANALAIRGLPRALRITASDGTPNEIPELIELRGEIYVSFAEFERINAEREAAGEEVFANPRNLAAGTIRQLDPKIVAARKLEVVFYGIGACAPESTRPATQRALHEQVRRWGLPGVEKYWTARSADELWAAVQELKRARPRFAFPTDGAVAKLDPVPLQRQLGATDHAPRWAIAYKYAPERATTRVRAITVQVGRTGVLTPVAELEPVELGGSTIVRATLHNRAELARRDVRVGDFVFIEKAGEIIPAIVGVDMARRRADAGAFAFPEKCPACGTPVVQRADEVAVRCPNPACPAQVRRRLEHFASKDAVDIDGFGPVLIAALVARGVVKDIPDLYALRREQLLALPKIGDKSADRLLAAIEASKRAELWRFVYGLGIPQVGTVAAKGLARRFDSLEALASAVPGDDPALRAVAEYFADARRREIVARLAAAGVRPRAADAAASGPLAGKVFVLTGTLPTLTRAEATAKIEAAGGVVSGSVSKKTTRVVAGADPGAKLDQARKLGVPVIDEVGLRQMLGEP